MSEKSLESEDTNAGADKDKSSPEPSEGKECSEFFMVVEDSKPNRKILAVLLKSLGFGVIEAGDGSEAFEMLEKEKEKNIVGFFSDIMMPKMDGIEFLGKVRENERFKETPFLLITANPQKDFVIEAKKHKVSGFIVKPMVTEKIISALKTTFPGRNFKIKKER